MYLQIYIPINIKDWHWILAQVDIIEHHVDFYDSYLRDTSYRSQLELLWEIISHVLKATKVYDTQPQLNLSLKPFKHGFIRSCPQQKNVYVTEIEFANVLTFYY